LMPSVGSRLTTPPTTLPLLSSFFFGYFFGDFFGHVSSVMTFSIHVELFYWV
jgi:hypothetical protein